MWTIVPLLLLSEALVLTSADYGQQPIWPNYIIKPAGESKVYNWAGYTQHYPTNLPRLPVHLMWNPYKDPMYTAFWVPKSTKGKSHGHTHGSGHDIGHSHGHGSGHSHGHGSGHNHGHSSGHEVHSVSFGDDIPSGFGPPKDIVHSDHSSDHVVHEVHHIHEHHNDDGFTDFNLQKEDPYHNGANQGKSISGFGHPKQGSLSHDQNTVIIEHHDSVPSFNTPAIIVTEDSIEDDFPIKSSPPVEFISQQPVLHNQQPPSISPGNLIGKGQIQDDHFVPSTGGFPVKSKAQNQPSTVQSAQVVPLVKHPLSAPLPLEDENALDGNFDVHIKIDS